MNSYLLSILATLYLIEGREAVKRAITPPQSAIEAVCAKTGARVDEALAARGKMVSATMAFLDQCIVRDGALPELEVATGWLEPVPIGGTDTEDDGA